MAISAMPAGSGRAISAAGACRIGVRSAQLAATDSIEATPISPLTKEDDDVGEREADALDPPRDEVQDQTDLRMVAPPIGHSAANEGQDR